MAQRASLKQIVINMKNKQKIITYSIGLFFILFSSVNINASVLADKDSKTKVDGLKMSLTVKSYYKYRADKTAGREIEIDFNEEKLYGDVTITVACEGKNEKFDFSFPQGANKIPVLLPYGAGVEKDCKASVTVKSSNGKLRNSVIVPAKRHWTVYLYNHSHVDLGYSAPQEICEFIHKRNIDEGIKLAEETKNYPAGAHYKWNPEVTWPLERLWNTATPEKKESVKKAIREGALCIDASYAHLTTSVCSDEELFHLFRFSREMQKLTDVPMDVFQQMDIPGMTWGLIPVMAQEGVRYIMEWPNGGDRIGHTGDATGKPYWWVGPDGKSKVLFFQPGSYANSGSMSKGASTGRPWFGQRDVDKIPAVIKTGHANVNFLNQLGNAEKAGSPYDFLVLSWALWDNTPLDADVPHAVKTWNEEYAFPHIKIAGGHEIMKMIETKYGDQLPTVTGDFTEYWTDGSGTAAKLTGKNRNAREKLVQAETIWTMLNNDKASPRAEFDEAWRYIILADEHTWCSENPTEPYFFNAIWKVKQSYFREANDRTQALFEKALAPVTDKSNGAKGPATGPSEGGIAVFNTHSWNHGGLVTLNSAESGIGDRVIDDKGVDVPSQRLSTGELAFLATDVPAFGSRHFRVMTGKSSIIEGCKLNGLTIENEEVQVIIDSKNGNITHLIDRSTGINFVDEKINGGSNAFRWLPADSINGKADTDIIISTIENGPLVIELRVDSKASGCRSVSRSIRLIHGQPWVEISNIVDKLPLVAKDGIHFGFGFDIPQPVTRVDIPWGVMRLEDDQLSEANRNWMVLQRWLDISNDKKGITWCSLDASLFESGSMTANQLGRWGSHPWIRKLEPSSIIYSWAMNNHWHTNFPLTQDGPVTFRYRILPHGAYDAVTANRFGMEQAQPLAHVTANNDPKIKPLITLDNDRVSVSILKPSNNGKGTILRMRSLSNEDEMVKFTFPAGVPNSIHICDITEEAGPKVSNEVTVPAMGMMTLLVDW